MKFGLIVLILVAFTKPSFAVDGTRKFTNVIDGILAFGGGKQEGRPNKNPLQDKALNNLCNKGFSEAIYLYSENAVEKEVSCGNEALYYHHIDWRQPEAIMKRIHQAITSGAGPVYVHCWNGKHASNAIASVALKQFCGWSDEASIQFWDAHSEDSSGDVRKWSVRRIKKYQVNPRYTLDPATQQSVCP